MRGARPFGLAFVVGVRLVFALAVLGLALEAQAPRIAQLTIAPKNATIDDGFTSLWSLRELSDGRVLFADVSENRLFLADFSTGELRSIGVAGRGPGEVLYFHRIFAMRGDSTLVVDAGSGARWVVYEGDKPARTYPPDHPLIAASREPAGRLVGAALDGSLLIVRNGGGTQQEFANGWRRLDSSQVVRIRPGGTRGDSLLRIQGDDNRVEMFRGGGRNFSIFRVAYLSTPDRATMAPDGWIAVATQRPYRVTWWSPEGQRIVGPDLGWPVLPVTNEEKQAYVRRTMGANAKPNANGWAETIPPFGGLFGSSHSPDGKLFLRKVPTAADPRTRYDVIDRTGRIVAELVLPENEYLAGFGARSVYKVVKDEDDLLHLQRHPWP